MDRLQKPNACGSETLVMNKKIDAEMFSIESVKIALITKDAKLQVRNKLNASAVKRYANLMKAGTKLDPIRIARVDDMLLLVDGWHRLAAHDELRRTFVDAEVISATRHQAVWMAASANLEHGLQLKSAELRNVFRAYISSRQHSQGKGRIKSYREIGVDLGKGHTTIRNWMQKDFPEIAVRMSGNGEVAGVGGLQEIAAPNLSATDQHMALVREVFQSSSDPTFRGNVIGAIRETLADMEASGGWTEPSKPEF